VSDCIVYILIYLFISVTAVDHMVCHLCEKDAGCRDPNPLRCWVVCRLRVCVVLLLRILEV